MVYPCYWIVSRGMILWLLVIIFTDSFGIKVSTFHLYYLKIKERQSSNHHTSHNTPQGKEKERGGRKDQIKEGREIHLWDQTLSKGFFVIRFCELSKWLLWGWKAREPISIYMLGQGPNSRTLTNLRMGKHVQKGLY